MRKIITKARLKQIVKEELSTILEMKNLSTSEQERRRDSKIALQPEKEVIKNGLELLLGEMDMGLCGDVAKEFETSCRKLQDSGIKKLQNYRGCMDMVEGATRGIPSCEELYGSYEEDIDFDDQGQKRDIDTNY
jgi:hypothetical protein